MSVNYDAVVVGGGIAGLTSAAYLCKGGVRTLLVEKADKTGGLVNTFWHEGFAFDGGIRAFENSGILLPMLRSLGIDIEFITNPVSIGIGDQWVKLKNRGSLKDYTALLKSAFPENAPEVDLIADEISKVIKYMDVLYGIDNPLFHENLQDLNYLRKTLLPWFVKYQKNIRKIVNLGEPVYDYLGNITSNKALIDMIAQHFFKETPAFFALSYFGLYLDYVYPMGGTGTLAEKGTEFINAAGGEVLTSTTAVEVDSGKNEIVLSDGKTVGYKKLIWAANQKSLYAAVMNLHSPKANKQKIQVEAGVGSDSILTLFIGFDLENGYFVERSGTHGFYTPVKDGLSSLPPWEKAGEKGLGSLYDWVGQFLEKTTYEISCPALRDSSLAPEGKTGVIMSTLFDYHLVRYFFDLDEYESFKSFCSNKILDILESSIFPNSRQKVLFSICSTPMTIERLSGNAHGAITGWSFSNEKIPSENSFAKIRRSIKTPIKDVVQCGQWTFSPSGLPVSIITGKFAADAVCKALKG